MILIVMRALCLVVSEKEVDFFVTETIGRYRGRFRYRSAKSD
jgi:hypothetical protein